MIKSFYTLTIFLGVLLLFLSPWESKGQQAPQYTQYYENQLSINPAYAGISNKICLTAIHRDQWVGWEGSPVTNNFNAHSNLNNPYVQGVGISVLDDELGPLTNRGLSISASHRFLFGPGEMSIGLNIGGFQRSVGEEDWNPPDVDAVDDPAIPNEESSDFVPDLGLGLHYSTPDWYAGISTQHIHEPEFEDWGGPNNSIHRVFYFTGGYNYQLTQDLILQPKTLIKADRARLQTDLTATLRVGDGFWGGASYRLQDAVGFHIGANPFDDLRIGYSYDLTTSEVREFSSGSHEIMLSYCFRITLTEDQPIEILTPRFL